MTDSGLHTDGNGAAGVLSEIFAQEATLFERICQSCRTRSAVGSHRAYRGAGIVLRCPACGDIGARIGTLAEYNVIEIRGTWVMRRPD
jgi:hypothetical protein